MKCSLRLCRKKTQLDSSLRNELHLQGEKKLHLCHTQLARFTQLAPKILFWKFDASSALVLPSVVEVKVVTVLN
jgi:hypothetical protein